MPCTDAKHTCQALMPHPLAQELDEMEGRGQVGWPHVCIASYDLVQKMKGSRRYGVIIADESHMLKSRTVGGRAA